MHSIVFVLLPPDTANILGKTKELLAPFYQELELPPHKRGCEELDVKSWKERYCTDELSALAEELRKDIGLDFGADEEGLYEMTTYNEMGRWDRWDGWGPMKFFKRDTAKVRQWGKELEQSICIVSDLLSESGESVPHSMVTPDGKWHDVDEFGYNTALQFQQGIQGLHPENVEPTARWTNHVRAALAKYADHLLLVLNCHS